VQTGLSIVDEIANETDEFKVCKVNVDEEPELAQSFNVASIPPLAVVKNGKLVNRAVGARPKEAILSMLKG
jgi:thioredoxin 1